MSTYVVNWNKTYYASGSVEIEADSSEVKEKILRADKKISPHTQS